MSDVIVYGVGIPNKIIPKYSEEFPYWKIEHNNKEILKNFIDSFKNVLKEKYPNNPDIINDINSIIIDCLLEDK